MFLTDMRLNKYVIKLFLKNSGTLEPVPESYKNQQNAIKLLIVTLMHLNLSLIPIRLEKWVIKLSMLILLQLNLFLNTIRLMKCAIKLLIDVFCIWLYS